MMLSGSTTFFFDFDIDSTAPTVIGSPVVTCKALPSRRRTSSGNSHFPRTSL